MGSVRMDTKTAIFLFLTHIALSSGQGTGSKSRFDDILSKFGFGVNPVALEQQTQKTVKPPELSIKTVVAPFKKEKRNHDKKKFSDALEKFGFGISKKIPHVVELKTTKVKGTLNKQTPSKQSSQSQKNQNYKELPEFGLGNSRIPTFPPIFVNDNLNKPQFVKVVTSTFSPKHQITPRASNHQSTKIPKTSLSKLLSGEHAMTKQTEKNNGSNFKTIKKLKKSNEKQDSYLPTNDPTFFVTPKSATQKDLINKNGKGHKKHHAGESKKKRNHKSNRKTKHLHQSHVGLAFSDASFTTSQPLLVTTKVIPVDFGETQLSTQRPRNSRQQDLTDKTNALAALFNVAGGTNEKKEDAPKPLRSKETKGNKAPKLNINSNPKKGSRQGTRTNISVKSKRPERRKPSNIPVKSKRPDIRKHSNTPVKSQRPDRRNPSNIQSKPLRPEKRKPSNKRTGTKNIVSSPRPKKKANPLAALFSLVKDDAKDTRINPSSKRTQQSRKSSISVASTQRSHSRPNKRPSQSSTKTNLQIATTARGQGRTTPRTNNVSASTRRGNRPPT